MIEWFKSLWGRFFGRKEEEIPQVRPEPSPPPRWNGGFEDINNSIRKLETPRHRIEPPKEEPLDDDSAVIAGIISSAISEPAAPTPEPWSGNGGEFNGGGASGSWDEPSDSTDSDSTDSDTSNGSEDSDSSTSTEDP